MESTEKSVYVCLICHPVIPYIVESLLSANQVTNITSKQVALHQHDQVDC